MPGEEINLIQYYQHFCDLELIRCYIFNSYQITFLIDKFFYRAVTDPRDGRRVALKKLPNVFLSYLSAKRAFRELKMLCFFKHENVCFFIELYGKHILKITWKKNRFLEKELQNRS